MIQIQHFGMKCALRVTGPSSTQVSSHIDHWLQYQASMMHRRQKSVENSTLYQMKHATRSLK